MAKKTTKVLSIEEIDHQIEEKKQEIKQLEAMKKESLYSELVQNAKEAGMTLAEYMKFTKSLLEEKTNIQ